MEKLIEELTKVRPELLSKEGFKLFEKIIEIIDKNKELESALNNSVSKDEIKEVIQRIDYDIKKTREVKLERYSDYDGVRLKAYVTNSNEAYITKSNEIKSRLQELLNKGE